MECNKEPERFLVTRKIFTSQQEWKVAKELLRRKTYKVLDRKRHLLWEWMAIIKNEL